MKAAAWPWAGQEGLLGGDMLLFLFFSGFGPFGEHTVNASWIAVQVTGSRGEESGLGLGLPWKYLTPKKGRNLQRDRLP